jgi:methylamine---glutamate N-methyltransferase subunit C
VQVHFSGGTRSGSSLTTCMSPGTDAVAIGRAALIALGDESPHLDDEAQDDLVAAAG